LTNKLKQLSMPDQASPLSITIASIVSRGLYLFLFILIGNVYGSSTVTDDLFLIYSPIVVIVTVIAGISEIVIMPTIHKADDLQCSRIIFFRIIKFSVVFVFVFSLIVLPVFMYLNNKLYPMVLLILLPIPVISTLSSLLANFLNARNQFIKAALSPTIGASFSCLLVLILPSTIINMCLIFLCYEIGRVVYLSIYSAGFLSIHNGSTEQSGDAQGLFSKTIRNAGLQGIASLLVGLNPMIDILFAKMLGGGAISSVEYANRIWVVIPLLLTGILMVTHSKFSYAAASNSFSNNIVGKTALGTGLLGAGISIIAILVSTIIVKYLFGFGVMEPHQIQALSDLLAYYFVGAAPLIVGLVYVRAFSAVGSIKPITLSAIVSVLSNIVLNFFLIKVFGLNGIGLATSVTTIITTMILVIWFHFVNNNRSIDI